MDKSNLLKTLIILSILSSGCISVEFTGNQYSIHKVTESVDGDTVKVNSSEGEKTVRLVGVNTPETYGENNPGYFNLEDTERNRQCLRKIGEEATNYVESLLVNRTVKVRTDSIEDNEGSYGRELRYIIVNETTLGEKLLRKGYATVYPSNFEMREKFHRLETKAAEREIGVWNCS